MGVGYNWIENNCVCCSTLGTGM